MEIDLETPIETYETADEVRDELQRLSFQADRFRDEIDDEMRLVIMKREHRLQKRLMEMEAA